MLNHKKIVFLFITLLLVFIVFKVEWYFYLILGILFLGLTSWGVFDIRLGYFYKVFWKKMNNQNFIALTFDDGPTSFTPQILELLDKYNQKATFFCIGKNIVEQKEIAKAIIENGHQLANHSFTHPNSMGFLSTDKVIDEIEKTDEVIESLTNKKSNFYRPPFGITNPHIAKALKKLNKKNIGWSIRSLDTVITDEKVIYNKIIKRVKAGEIILLHDTSLKSVLVLEQLLLYLEKYNYKSVTIEKLLQV